ncbi:MAG: pyrroline-5-carboxylate reductase, partial [Flavobacteriales bacterium]
MRLNKNVGIIGCGNLGESIANGLLAEGVIDAGQLWVSKRKPENLAHLKNQGVHVHSSNEELIQNCELIVVALKPYTILEELSKNKNLFDSNQHCIISVATGISLSELQNAVGSGISVYRAMPNTGADVGTSLTCISSLESETKHMEEVQGLFNSIGETVVIGEDLMNASTVLGACGIAYVLRFMRAMIQGGVQIGFDAETATKVVAQTVKGASELIIQNQRHPEEEIDKVTTPKGCTIAGLNE